MDSKSPQGSDTPKTIATVVGKHADRVMDGLFSEIEEMLSGDLQGQEQPPSRLEANAAPEPQPNRAPAVYATTAPPSNSAPPALPATPTPSKQWPKVLAVVGSFALAIGGGLWWLQTQGKFSFAALTRGEMPFILSSHEDVQFADYLRRSFNKIENNASPIASAGITIPNPPSAEAAPATIAPGPSVKISVAKIIPGSPPTVEFIVDGQLQSLKGGDPIGNSGWVLSNASATEAVLKRNGEVRLLKVGEQL